MMQTKAFIALAVSVLLSMSCQQELVESVSTLTRDTDRISLAYNNSTACFTVRSVTPWTVRSDASWLTFDPSSGSGNGVDYTTVTVTAEANVADQRSAIIYLESSDGKCLEINATQESGFFQLGTPSISGAFRLNAAPGAVITVPYSKAQGGEEVTVSAYVSGDASEGITFTDYKMVIPNAGNGTISAPFSGLPVKMGDITVDARVIYNGADVFKTRLTANVFDEKTLLLLPASKFPWGGHYLEGTSGIRSVLGEALGVTVDDQTTTCTSTQPGTTDFFRSGMEDFMAARGLSGYEGSKVYEHGGYLKIGTSALGGYLMTPPLDAIENPTDISVQFDYVRWAGDTKEVTVSAVNGGELSAGVLSTAGKEYVHYNFTVVGATSQTRIKWAATDLSSPGARFLISNIEIALATAVREPLAVPENLHATAYESSVEFGWNPVTNATAYEAYIASAENPDFRKTQRTDKPSVLFDGLAPKTDYLVSVKAIYGRDEAFNSAESDALSVTTLFTLPQLSAPEIKIYKSERALAIVEFAGKAGELDGSRTFDLELRDAGGNVLRSYLGGNYAQSGGIYYSRFTFANLKTSTDYKIAVRRISTDATQYRDSEWKVLEYRSEADVNMGAYVFYEDFNNMWIGGDLVNLSFGPNTTYSTNYDLTKFVDESTSMSDCKVICYPPGSSGNAWTTSNPLAYLNTYWGKWNHGNAFDADILASESALQYRLYPAVGCVKYGTGSLNGYLVLPELRALTEPTDVTVTFDVIPYALPTAAAGELVGITDGATCSASLHSGSDGTIDGAVDGVISFSNKSAAEKGGWKIESHSFIVNGATANTRIVIASGNAGEKQGGKNRMWLDKVTVTKK